MAQFLSPGVVFNERFGDRVSNAGLDNAGTVGVVGVTERGPVGVPTRVTSMADFRSKFGGFINDGALAFWMESFFANSGGTGEIYVVRTAHYTDITDKATLTALKSSKTLADDGPGYSLSGSSPAITTAVGQTDFQIQLSSADGEGVKTVSIAAGLTSGADIAAAIQTAVRALTEDVGANAADYDNFVCEFTEDGRYILYNGSVGPTKTVAVTDGVSDNTADDFNLGLANGGTEQAAPIPSLLVEAESEGIWGDALDITVEQTNLVNTQLTADIADGDSLIRVKRLSGVKSGTILEITDTTAPINPQIFVEVDRVEGDIVFLTAPVSLASTIEGTGVTPASVRSLDFSLTVQRGGSFRETFTNLSMNPRNVQDYVVTRVNNEAEFIRVTDLGSLSPVQFSRPSIVSNTFLTGGANGLGGLVDTDFIGDTVEANGMYALQDIETLNFLAIPDRPTGTVHSAMVDFAELKDRFQVALDPPLGLDSDAVAQHVEDNQLESDYAHIDWPNLVMRDPRNRDLDYLVAPSAYRLGMYTRNINDPGIGIARPPGGIEFRAIGIVDVEDRSAFNKSTRDFLLPKNINVIAGFQGSIGIFPFGVETLGIGDNDTEEIQARAVVQKLKREGTRILQSLLISNFVDEETLAKASGISEDYLRQQRADGVIRGRTEQESFSVYYGLDINPPEQMARGEIKGIWGVRVGKALKGITIDLVEHVPGQSQEVI